MVEVRITAPFKRRFKALSKRYRKIQSDIKPVVEALQKGQFEGDRIPSTTVTVFKVRAKNSDIPTGKSGGYRIIYQLVSPKLVFLLLIYAKSDQTDVAIEDIEEAVRQSLAE
ncbi:MAG: type II toxin-antitoxin system RelE/ParE family toxin [Cyanobacteria bacterium P01_F01_bin.150]